MESSATLASLTRETGPKVVKGDPARKETSTKVAHVAHHQYAPAINISDSSLKFTHVLYNLSPAGLKKNTQIQYFKFDMFNVVIFKLNRDGVVLF